MIFVAFGGVVNGSINDDTMISFVGGSTLNGGAGDDQLIALDRGARMNGGAGNDTVIGGVGNDIMSGGRSANPNDPATPNSDLFVMFKDSGNDRILDFEPGRDHILLTGKGITNANFAAKVSLTQGPDGSGHVGFVGTPYTIDTVRVPVLTRSDFVLG